MTDLWMPAFCQQGCSPPRREGDCALPLEGGVLVCANAAAANIKRTMALRRIAIGKGRDAKN
jgi:hypothetical protein